MYGLNNNTGTTYTNSGNEITKLNKSTTNAYRGNKNEKTFNDAVSIMSGVNNFKNTNTGGDKLMSMAQIIASFMG